MIELERTAFYRTAPLFASHIHSIPLCGVLDGLHPGRVFVDDVIVPSVAFVWTPWGYHYLAGAPDHKDFCTELKTRLAIDLIPNSIKAGESTLLLTLSPESEWAARLDDLLPPPAPICIYRQTFAFNGEEFARLANWQSRVPEGYWLLPIDADLAEELRDDIEVTWGSLPAFRKRGFGFALCNNDRVVSSCLAAFVARHAVEIGVSTAEPFRRQGFGTLTSSAMIATCLERGLRPNWECFWDNEPSVALAHKLGFSARGKYPLYYWEANVRG